VETQLANKICLVLGEHFKIFGQVHSVKPFGYGHLGHTAFVFEQFRTVVKSFLAAVSVFQEMTLQLGHGDLAFWKRLGELVGKIFFIWEEFEEESFNHAERCIGQFDMHVASTWSDQSWIEALLVIRRHNKDTTLLGADTVESIEETRE
jgi:hypothetical protein